MLHRTSHIIVAYLRNFGRTIVDKHGRMIAFPKVKTPLWTDLVAAVPGWFQSQAGGDPNAMHSKVYTYYGSISPTQQRGPQRFLDWIKELAGYVEKPLPVDDEGDGETAT